VVAPNPSSDSTNGHRGPQIIAALLSGAPISSIDLAGIEEPWADLARAIIGANGTGRQAAFETAIDGLPNGSEILAAVFRVDPTNAHVAVDDRSGLVRLSEVQPEQVQWAWAGRIPLGKLTVLDGDPGLGKSTVVLDLVARLTTGRAMPDASGSDLPGPVGVVLLSAEDGLADTIQPRLEAAGADLARVFALTHVPDGGAGRLPQIPDDLEYLEAIIRDYAAKLLVVDPLMAYLGQSVNTHRDQDVRRALAPLARLGERTGAAVLSIRHLNKAAEGNPLYRGGGSIGIIGAARSGLLVARDPDDPTGARRALASQKSNLAPTPTSLTYVLEPTASGAARVAWQGPTSFTAAALLGQPASTDSRSALHEAMDFLRDALASGPGPVKEVEREAKEAGIARSTLRRAQRELRIKPRKLGRPGESGQQWVWALPEGAQDNREAAEDAHPRSMSTFGPNEHLRGTEDGEELPW
jgi:putative DNA primase/helicase